MIKIHLGCNGQIFGVIPGINGPAIWGPAEDWINIDIDFDPEMISRTGTTDRIYGYPRALACDFRTLPFPDDFADIAYAHHSLEHIYVRDVLPTLKEWHRVLKPSGLVHINVPDLLWIAEQLVRTQGNLLWSEMGEWTGEWETSYTKLIYGIFGDQSTDFQTHKTGFTAPYLTTLLEQAGFLDIRTDHTDGMGLRCLIVEGRK